MKKFGSALGFDEADETENLQEVFVSRQQFKISVYSPKSFNDLKVIADSLLARSAVLICLDSVDSELRRRSIDYMNGMGYAVNAQVEKISENVILYAPDNAFIEKQYTPTSKSNKWF